MFILLSSEAVTQSVLKKKSSENMQQSYGRAPMAKCDFNKVVSNFIEIALQHGCSPVNLLHIFKKPFLDGCFCIVVGFVDVHYLQ